MLALRVILLLIAAICFFIRGIGVNTGQVDMVAMGFGFVALSFIV